MPVRYGLLILWLGWTSGICLAEELGKSDQVLAKQVQKHIEFLASEELAGRSGRNSLRAADYVVDHFQEWGWEPVFPQKLNSKLSDNKELEGGKTYEQFIPGAATPAGTPTILGKNVAGLLRGSDAEKSQEYILIAAHHDHLGKSQAGIFHGADDNASGVAMVLELARVLGQSSERAPRSILLVSFDLEEHLLFGSRWFTAHPPVPLEQIKLVIVADMLGRSLGDMPLDTFFMFGSEHGQGVREYLAQVHFGERLQPVLLSDDFVGTRSDYGPFRDRRIPFVFFSTGQSRDYHTVRDTSEKINFQQVADITQGIQELVLWSARLETGPAWIEQPKQHLDEVSTILNIVAAIEEQADAWQLSPLQRLFVSQTRHQAEKILKQGTVAPKDLDWLTRTTQLLLFSVF